ncbi:MAG: ABC transporter ATP-binding protein [Halobacteriovoraceae bacterium]|nr:ABC transporter ATP-binding protein [Halobacteriovoraceae bacterium]
MSRILVELKQISKNFGRNLVLDNISLKLKENSIHGLLGPNGAGKSTTMRVLCGLTSHDKGEVYFDGQLRNNQNEFACKIGFLSEDVPLYESMRVENFIKYLLKLRLKNIQNIKDNLEKALEKCQLIDHRKRLIGNLSKGLKQRVGLAQAIAHGPKLIILDEPTVGLDPYAIMHVRDLIQNLAKDHTILLSSHQLHEVANVCNEFTFIEKGRVVKTANMENYKNNLEQVFQEFGKQIQNRSEQTSVNL